MLVYRIVVIFILTVVLSLRSFFSEPFFIGHAVVFFIASVVVAISGAAASRLHRTLFRPEGGIAGRFGDIFLELVLRFMAGGIGYSTTVLFAKKFDWIPVRDVPFGAVFYTGAAAGIFYYGILSGITYLKGVGSRDTHGTT